MAAQDIVTEADLGPEFDIGNIQANNIRLKLGSGLAIQLDGTIVTNLNINTRNIYSLEYTGRSANGTTTSFVRNSTLTRTAVGRWQIRFDTAHPDGANYSPYITAEEQSGNRDTPDITIVQGTQNANGFDIQITTGDNGGTADAYVDTPWSFGVSSPVLMVESVTT